MGQFDGVFRETAVTIIDQFVDTLSPVRRIRQAYESGTGSDQPVTESEIKIKLTPPDPYTIREVDGDAILSQDLKVFAAALTIDDLGFDPIPAGEVSIVVETRGRTYKAVTVKPIASGDEIALYQFQLRL